MAITRRPARWLVLVTGLTQLASPTFLFVGNSSLQSGASGDPAVVPAGYTFAVWAVICLLGAAWAVWQMRESWADDVLDRLALPLAGVFAGFTVWLVFSETGPRWATVVVFTAMLIGLLGALRTVHTYADGVSRWSRAGAILLHLTLGTYAGWTSVAVWVDLATVLADGGAPIAGVAGVAGQLAVLAGATATCCAVIVALHPTPAYTLTAAWALVGAVVGAITVSAPLLAAAAGAGLAVVVAVAVTTRWHVSGRPHSRTAAPGASVADGHAR